MLKTRAKIVLCISYKTIEAKSSKAMQNNPASCQVNPIATPTSNKPCEKNTMCIYYHPASFRHGQRKYLEGNQMLEADRTVQKKNEHANQAVNQL